MSSNPGPMPPLSPAELAPRRRGWGPFLAWLFGAVGLGLAAACVWGAVTVLGPYLSHDPPELIDNPPMIAALAEPCAAVQAAAAEVDVSAPGTEQATRLADVVVAIDGLAASVGALPADLVDGDLPTRYWVIDWETLGARITDYSVALTNGAQVELDTPVTADGFTIVTRMDVAAPLGCRVPAVLVTLDPTPPPAPSIEG
ncbi:hypothetical protein [Oerskovia enterophila]|uniref:Uncharacterized protein n=1 Tax=Oerskovia enterophila TaxID=43678 RepID=A0A163QLS3_9CELL|nr:hypothetical protein [Oerskovia enterophila]KZM34305.1 hypothetical protein OJAG_31370 [Oerskovia enterophila]OCI30732.1 hypothetical protein OERS_26020 [Oerskovia enterophila]